MSARKNSPQIPELPGMPKSANYERSSSFFAADIVNPRRRSYKGGRTLPCATRFRYWRTTDGKSIAKIAARLEDGVREYGITPEYLQTRLYELEQGRFKPPTWLILLLADTYDLKFPWWEFLETSVEAQR